MKNINLLFFSIVVIRCNVVAQKKLSEKHTGNPFFRVGMPMLREPFLIRNAGFIPFDDGFVFEEITYKGYVADVPFRQFKRISRI